MAHVGALDVAALVSSRRHCRRMADNKESLRALKIKTGIMTRVKKELAMYRQEVETEGAKLEKMKAEGRDPFDIKQQDPPMVAPLLSVLRRHRAEERVLLASFSARCLEEVRERGALPGVVAPRSP